MRFEHAEDFALAEQACEKLSDVEKQIITSIYLHEEQVTKLAKQLNYSRCHLSRMKTAAINKLRQEMANVTGETASDANLKHERRSLTSSCRVRTKSSLGSLEQAA